MKLPAFLKNFQTEWLILRVNKIEITVENAFSGNLLRLKITMNQVKTDKLGFRYFCRFFTRALTVRKRSTYIYNFPALFGFCIFQAVS